MTPDAGQHKSGPVVESQADSQTESQIESQSQSQSQIDR